MPRSILFCLYLGLSFTRLITATPLPYPDHIPADASRLTMNTQNGNVIAFHSSGKNLGTYSIPQANASTLTRRGTGSCSPLTLDDAKKLPGWSKLEAEAKKNWGGGSYNLAVNPEDYKDHPATVCISSDTAMVKISGQPRCSTSKQSTDGKLVGTSGTVTLSSTEGTQLKQHTSVTKESSIGAGMSISAHVGIPEIAEVTAEMSTSVTLSNSLTKSFESTADNSQTQSVTVKTTPGKKCHLEFAVKSCEYSGTGSIRTYATGWVWFNFNDQTNGHYKWALKIDDVLKDINDRSSTIDFDASGSLVTKSNFAGKCA